MARQLSFDLPVRTARGRGDFFVSPANALALAQLDGWRDWPGGKLALSGPQGAGKTHLTHVWAAETGARIVAARHLCSADVARLAESFVAVEDVPDIAGDAAAQEALFHLHNLVLAEGQRLLVTGAGDPAQWPLTLPDLVSRLSATAVARIEPPDDALLAALLTKLFADRQLTPTPDTIPFLARRITRSFGAATAMVDRLDKAALAQRREINRKLAAELLDPGDG